MNEIFGLPTATLAGILAALLALAVLSLGGVALTSRTMFRMGVRNIRRRKAQTALIVAGLTLSTLVVTAAFTTGDTINHSFTKASYATLQRTDLAISFNGPREISGNLGVSIDGEQATADIAVVSELEEAFADDDLIEGFNPLRFERVAAVNGRTGDALAAVQLAGYDPARLGSLGGLRLTNGEAADLYLSEREVLVSVAAANDLNLEAGDILTLHAGGTPYAFTVAGIVEDELASGVLGYSYSRVPGGVALPLSSIESMLGHPGTVNWISVMLRGGVRDTVDSGPIAAERIESYLAEDGADVFSTVGGLEAGRPIVVDTLKADAIDEGQKSGEQFITIFIALGMFAIAAGVMLVFMIFVMLAAERKAEMGISRAVGARRRHLVQSFLSEGMTYALAAGIPGVVLGVLASLALTVGLLKLTGGDEFALISPFVTAKSIVIGYCLGAVLTFITVLFSALKVSHVNIVAAIRGTDDQHVPFQRKLSVKWMLIGIVTLPLLPLGLHFLLHRGFGVRTSMVWAPLGIMSGLGLMMLGTSSGQLIFFATGISIIPLCLAAIATTFRAPGQPTWSLAGIALLAYWGMPGQLHDRLFGEFSFDIEMFVISGVMMVVAATLVIVFNASFLTRLVRTNEAARYRLPMLLLGGAAVSSTLAGFIGDSADGAGKLLYLVAIMLVAGAAVATAAARFASLAPALKMAVAYPLASRFRTGMTLAMFSLVVFSLTVLSILMANFSSLSGGDNARGKLDVVVSNGSGELPEGLRGWLGAAGVDTSAIIGAGRVTLAQPNQAARLTGEQDWVALPVRAGDDAFFNSLAPSLDARAEGFATDADVLAAVAANPAYAILDRASLRGDFSEYAFDAAVEITGESFAPVTVEIIDQATGRTATVTVIGSFDSRIPTESFAGLYVNADSYRSVYGEPSYQQAYLYTDGAGAEELVRGIRSSLATSGVDAEEVARILEREEAMSKTFNRMFQAFMALGLFVGIAGLGVIAMRSVVERRQQIGMLRAIGFQRVIVTAIFLFESAFVAVMGILAGVSGGTVIGRNLMTSDVVTGGGEQAPFTVPWDEIGILSAVALGFALLMTWFPSRSASRVPVAEALRYE